MTNKTNDYQRVWLFFLVAYAFSWVFWIPHALIARGVALLAGLADFLAGPLNPAAFGPFFAAFLLTFLQQRGRGVLQLLRRGIDFRFKKIWLLAILLLPFVLFGGSIWAAVLAGVRPADFAVISNPPYSIALLTPNGVFSPPSSFFHQFDDRRPGPALPGLYGDNVFAHRDCGRSNSSLENMATHSSIDAPNTCFHLTRFARSACG